ncbi:response regulator [Roseobacter sp.]|uniref:response regulator n=1 Tax=Roseobacter sp. TaxID=1907202 RepID=UPI003298CD68
MAEDRRVAEGWMASILIIDDYPEDRELLADLLNDADPDTTVQSCTDGTADLAKITACALDCVLLDMCLDGEDGLQVLASIGGVRRSLPVIVLTGQGSEKDAVEVFVAGAAYYLPKRNLTTKTLCTAVMRVLKQAQIERELKEKRVALERSNRLDAVGQLAAGIAHDFNNQLGALRMSVELIKDAVVTDRAQSHVNAALKVIAEASHLATRLLSLFRQGELVGKDVALVDVFSDFQTLASRSVADPVLLHISDITDDMVVHCDPNHLLNALLNLVMNANDAILEKEVIGTIRVTAERIDNEVHIVVADDGAGMSEDVLQTCSDPFFTTKLDRNGTGLGLAMVQNFAVEARGALFFQSTLREGTAVTLVLPKGARMAMAHPSPPQDNMLPHSGAHILLAEDQLMLAMMTKELLESEGMQVSLVNDAADALEFLTTNSAVDLLITDLKMPRMSGIELAKEVRVQWPHIKIIYTTGYADNPDHNASEILGPILQKPVEPNELIARILTALNTDS